MDNGVVERRRVHRVYSQRTSDKTHLVVHARNAAHEAYLVAPDNRKARRARLQPATRRFLHTSIQRGAPATRIRRVARAQRLSIFGHIWHSGLRSPSFLRSLHPVAHIFLARAHRFMTPPRHSRPHWPAGRQATTVIATSLFPVLPICFTHLTLFSIHLRTATGSFSSDSFARWRACFACSACRTLSPLPSLSALIPGERCEGMPMSAAHWPAPISITARRTKTVYLAIMESQDLATAMSGLAVIVLVEAGVVAVQMTMGCVSYTHKNLQRWRCWCKRPWGCCRRTYRQPAWTVVSVICSALLHSTLCNGASSGRIGWDLAAKGNKWDERMKWGGGGMESVLVCCVGGGSGGRVGCRYGKIATFHASPLRTRNIDWDFSILDGLPIKRAMHVRACQAEWVGAQQLGRKREISVENTVSLFLDPSANPHQVYASILDSPHHVASSALCKQAIVLSRLPFCIIYRRFYPFCIEAQRCARLGFAPPPSAGNIYSGEWSDTQNWPQPGMCGMVVFTTNYSKVAIVIDPQNSYIYSFRPGIRKDQHVASTRKRYKIEDVLVVFGWASVIHDDCFCDRFASSR